MESIKKFENMRIENMSKINGGERQKTHQGGGVVVKDKVNGNEVITAVGWFDGPRDHGTTTP